MPTCAKLRADDEASGADNFRIGASTPRCEKDLNSRRVPMCAPSTADSGSSGRAIPHIEAARLTQAKLCRGVKKPGRPAAKTSIGKLRRLKLCTEIGTPG